MGRTVALTTGLQSEHVNVFIKGIGTGQCIHVFFVILIVSVRFRLIFESDGVPLSARTLVRDWSGILIYPFIIVFSDFCE